MLIKRFDINHSGRDFVVGDIHGCMAQLTAALDAVDFDDVADRLFSVGDLVDRGAHSDETAYLINRPWFHSVRGNHEQMAIDYVKGLADPAWYARNGGKWFICLSPAEQADIAAGFESLPIVIIVGDTAIIHADPCCYEFEKTLTEIEAGNDQVITNAIWGRGRISCNDCIPIKGIRQIYCGHTPIDTPRTLGNVHYIDTGAVFGNKLTLIEIAK